MTAYSKLKVVDLKAELKKRGLPQTGLKQALVDRLEEADVGAGDASTQDVNNDESIAAKDAQTEPGTEEIQEPPEVSKKSVPDTIPLQSIYDSQQDIQKTPSPVSQPLQEGVDDSKKRKRRSQSPPPSTVEVAKKAKQIDAAPNGVVLKEDLAQTPLEIVETEVHLEKQVSEAASEVSKAKDAAKAPLKQSDGSQATYTDEKPGGDSVVSEEVAVGGKETAEELKEATTLIEPPSSSTRNNKVDTTESKAPPKSPISSQHLSSPKDTRFKDLFGQKEKPVDQRNRNRSATLDRSNDGMDIQEDRSVTPAIHIATPALYIRDFMRPLQPSALQSHLVAVATPSGTSPNPDILKEFHLDSVRTHCFALFAGISAASRVRSALHQQVWPDERTRKPLWVDFIPEDKITAWIETEKTSSSGPSGRSITGPRWEVVYVDREQDGSESNSIEAIHQEAGAAPRGRVISGAGRGVQGAPSGPRGDQDSIMRDVDHEPSRQRGREGAPPSRPAGSGFVALDTLFKSTTVKPRLYFLPVSPQLSARRMDRLADHAPKPGPRGRPARELGELKRYTFEDGDVIVDRGVELDHGPRGGYRGRGGGGYGPPRRGGWRDNGYRGGPDRRY